jgi:hypothetical protein
MLVLWEFALKLSIMERLLGDVWIVKKTQHASFVAVALKSLITVGIGCSLKETLEDAATVEIQKLGTQSTFARIIKDTKLAQRRNWTNFLSTSNRVQLKFSRTSAKSLNLHA